MTDWAFAHPVLFTILALPVIVTGCGLCAGLFGLEISRGR